MQLDLKKRNFLLVGGFFTLLLVGGIVYGWSLFVTPLETEFGWTRSQTTTAYTLCSVLSLCGGALDGVLASKTSPKVSLTTGVIIGTIGLILCWQINSLWMLYISYGIIASLGIGICYNAWLTTTIQWFPEKTGFASGLILLAYGASATVMSPVYSALINNFGWRKAFFIIAIAVLVIGFAASRIFSAPQEGYAEAILEMHKDDKKVDPVEDVVNLPPTLLFRQGTYWINFVWNLLLFNLGMSVIGQCSLIAQDTGASIAICTIAVSSLSAGSALGRLGFGILYDKIGRSKSMYLLAIIALTASVLLAVAYKASAPVLLLIALIIFGLSYGGLAMFRMAYSSSVFGRKYLKKNTGYVGLIGIVLSPIMNLIGIIKTNTGSYFGYFIIMICGCIVALILTPINIKQIEKMHKKYAGQNL